MVKQKNFGESKVNKGSLFQIKFKLANEKNNILIVEDDPNAEKIYKII